MPLHTQCLTRLVRAPAHRIAWRCVPARGYVSTTSDDPDWFQQLRGNLLKRHATSSREYLDVAVDNKLIDTLCTFLPRKWNSPRSVMPIGHHLVWFNPSLPADELLPDGTDPLQSPGEPWVRRMWAGGHVRVRPNDYYHGEKGFAVNSAMVCAERIQDVQLRGQGDSAKIFVTIDRRFAREDTLSASYEDAGKKATKTGEARMDLLRHFRQQLLSEHWGDAVLREERHLVFLKDKTPAELEAIRAGQMASVKYLERPGTPDFAHTLTPTQSLLFRYSALTFNAHLIHLDREYARNVEGHRNLLVHGPLSLTLMLQAMHGYIETMYQGQRVLESINYRNLAPLYCDEEMRICGRKKSSLTDEHSYDVWIEGPTGGVAVKGTVSTIANTATGGYKRQPSQANNSKKRVRKPAQAASRNVTSSASDPQSRRGSKQKSKESDTSQTPVSIHKPQLPQQPLRPTLSKFTAPSVLSASIGEVRRAQRHNRTPRTGSTHITTSVPSGPPVRKVIAPQSPMRPIMSLHARVLLRRSAPQIMKKFSIKPIPLIRTYRGRGHIHDPEGVASRHSRYVRDGVRKVGNLRIRLSDRAGSNEIDR